MQKLKLVANKFDKLPTAVKIIIYAGVAVFANNLANDLMAYSMGTVPIVDVLENFLRNLLPMIAGILSNLIFWWVAKLPTK